MPSMLKISYYLYLELSSECFPCRLYFSTQTLLDNVQTETGFRQEVSEVICLCLFRQREVLGLQSYMDCLTDTIFLFLLALHAANLFYLLLIRMYPLLQGSDLLLLSLIIGEGNFY